MDGAPRENILYNSLMASRKIIPALAFLIWAFCGKAKGAGDFSYQYNISPEAVFDFSKSYSADLGEITLRNTENKAKKFRYIDHSPLGYLISKKTGEITRISLVVHNSAPRKLDSIFWAFLGSATHYHPVKPKGLTKLTAYLNLNFYPRPAEIIKYTAENHENLEYHIFSPMNFPPNTGKNAPPEAAIRSIKVKNCGKFCP